MTSRITSILKLTNESIVDLYGFSNNIPSYLKIKVKRKVPKNLPRGEYLYDLSIQHSQKEYVAELSKIFEVEEFILRKLIFKFQEYNPTTRYITIRVDKS